jgi:RimJ/RimL family protein N-acetyltransferase
MRCQENSNGRNNNDDDKSTLKIRPARKSDKPQVLGFCINTFSWGDYIDQVWDHWISDNKHGRLFVATEDGALGNVVGVSHVAICPKGRSAWLEGVRVRPDCRRSGVATQLLDAMLAYASRNGAKHASAIVSSENLPSRRMIEKNGFSVVSRWVYYNLSYYRYGQNRSGPSKQQQQLQRHEGELEKEREQKIRKEKQWEGKEVPAVEATITTKAARLATPADLDMVWTYLQKSKIYGLSAARYVSEWHWYLLDKDTLRRLISEKRLILAEGDQKSDGKASENPNDDNSISGTAIINADGYWNKEDNSDLLQIVYLDSASSKSLQDILAFVANMVKEGGYERLHVICHDSKDMTSVLEGFLFRMSFHAKKENAVANENGCEVVVAAGGGSDDDNNNDDGAEADENEDNEGRKNKRMEQRNVNAIDVETFLLYEKQIVCMPTQKEESDDL